MKLREVFLIIPTFPFTTCAFTAVQPTLVVRPHLRLFKSTTSVLPSPTRG